MREDKEQKRPLAAIINEYYEKMLGDETIGGMWTPLVPLVPKPRNDLRDRNYAYGITPEHLAKWVTAVLEIGDILPLMVLRPDGSVDHMDLMKQDDSGAIGIAEIPAAALRETTEERIDEMVQEVVSQLESEMRIQQPRDRLWFDEMS